jgi:alpha-D-xyloside xylohydrolase
LAIKWTGKIIPDQTGKYQFHIKCYGPSKIYINGKLLPFVYQSVESYTDSIYMEAGKEYSFGLEKENATPGAFRAELFWKTPEIFAQEKVVEKREQTRAVYLPENTLWFDFWTGKSIKGGQTVKADAPIDQIPLFVRAGSIIPMGPFVQYAAEKPDYPLEIRVYPGADGNFVLYEDEGDNYNYEKGVFSTIAFNWNEVKHQLTIGQRKGTFPGMLEKRTFKIIIVNESKGKDIDLTEKPDKIVLYDGNAQMIKL